ncbi:MAG: hypothetical protein Q4E77_04380 [Conchiformibius sp.]|nr:hypothetical protein [Conchiformibius sp.]
MSEKDTLMQIEADLQSGKDVVEWEALRVMRGEDRQAEYACFRNHLFMQYFWGLLACFVIWFYDIGEDIWYIFCLPCVVYMLLWTGLILFFWKKVPHKMHTKRRIKIYFSRKRIHEKRLNCITFYRFHKVKEKLTILPELLEDKSPETAALRQRVQTLLHEKTGLHFE